MVRYSFCLFGAVVGLTLSGCGTVPQSALSVTSGETPSLSSKTRATGLWLPFGRNEAFLSLGEERALHAVQDYEKQILRTQPVDYHYEVSDVPTGYKVIIHYGLGHEKNQPIFPGASTIYEVDAQGRVQGRTLS